MVRDCFIWLCLLRSSLFYTTRILITTNNNPKFMTGVRDLMKALPSVWDGSATYLEQNTECASYVGKISKSTDVSFCK